MERIKTQHQRVAVYDLQVSPCENFFVDGVLVHNKTYFGEYIPAKPEALVGVWVLSDDYFEPRRCRLELRADGTGKCSFWHKSENSKVHHYVVESWELVNDSHFDRVVLTLRPDEGEAEERITGRLVRGMLGLKQFPRDLKWYESLVLAQEKKGETENEGADIAKPAHR